MVVPELLEFGYFAVKLSDEVRSLSHCDIA